MIRLRDLLSDSARGKGPEFAWFQDGLIEAALAVSNSVGGFDRYCRALGTLEPVIHTLDLDLEAGDLVEEARQLSVETGISFVDAVDRVKEKYLK